MDTGSPGFAPVTTSIVDGGNIQWVQDSSAAEVHAAEAGDTLTTYGQVYHAGVTDSSGQGSGIDAQVGYGTAGTDPSTASGWTWATATYNTDSGSNDEYTADVTLSTVGDWALAYRYSDDGGSTWLYCDSDWSSSSSPYDTAGEWLVVVSDDADGDGYDDVASGGTDCDDTDATIHPGATEVAYDGIDQDCDGVAADYVVSDLVGVGGTGDLLITEAMVDPDSVTEANGQWVEIYNNSDGYVGLDGLVLHDSWNYATYAPGVETLLEPGGYFVMGVNDDTATNGGATVDYDWGTSTTLSFYTSFGDIYLDDDVDLTELITHFNYDNTLLTTMAAGYSITLDPNAYDLASQTAYFEWCIGTSDYGGGPGDYGTPGAANDDCDADEDDYHSTAVGGDDCDDNDPYTHPAAGEYEDLDGNGATWDTYYDMNELEFCTTDADEDGYGDDSTSVVGDPGTDCDDTDATVHAASTWYADSDGDGFGDASVTTSACGQPSGYVDNRRDCDGTDAAINPTTTWYEDWDGDGYGDAAVSTTQCAQPSGYVLDDTDCDDTDATVTATSTWYADDDSDGYGDSAVSTEACSQPSGYVANDSDCDDTDATVGGPTTWYGDADSDGYGLATTTTTACTAPSGYVADASDCNDSDASIWPGAPEIKGDGIDQDCDGKDSPKDCATSPASALGTLLAIMVLGVRRRRRS